jgi:alkylresorcinol/alkylpyrone synthase
MLSPNARRETRVVRTRHKFPRIIAADVRFPERYERQTDVAREYERVGGGKGEATPDRIERFFTRTGVEGRHLVLPIEAYAGLGGFSERSTLWLKHALELGHAVVEGALTRAGLAASEIGLFVSNSVTGIAVPSLEARIMAARGDFASECRRLPLFGLGCVAGAAGIARVSEYLRANPTHAAILLCVELCSLTFQLSDTSTANVLASALFGDGAACVVMVGAEHRLARIGAGSARTSAGMAVVDTRSIFFPGTERTMGWDIVDSGFRIILSGSLPELARGPFCTHTRQFLADHDLTPADLKHWFGHPGGPAVIDAIEDGLKLPCGTLAASRRTLARVGNLSSASVLVLMEEALRDTRPGAGDGLLYAMGPGFCAELVLLRI